jgi:hypothetical protein
MTAGKQTATYRRRPAPSDRPESLPEQAAAVAQKAKVTGPKVTDAAERPDQEGHR